MAEFVMPILGADMRAGTLLAWRKQPGDIVRRGDVIAEIETDKANIEVECFLEGTIERLLVEPGAEVPVGTPLAIIGEAVAKAPEKPTPPVAGSIEPQAGGIQGEESSRVRAGRPGRAARPSASPAARRLAVELGVDLASITGTGPGGRVQLSDVEHAAARPPVRRERMRQAIAAAMTRSAREIPHFHLISTIEMSRALAWLRAENERRAVEARLLSGVLLLKAAALALREVPDLNAIWAQDHVDLKPHVHLGVAISLRDGLVAPALLDADRQTLDDLMRNFQDLVGRARAGTLRSSELSDSTATVTSLGEQGAETVIGVIYPPQVALIGFGKVMERPWVVDGRVEPRPIVKVTLTADHRVVDGRRGSLFLAAVDRLLQEPEGL